MQNIKFVVKVNRGGTRVPEYVQRVDPTPIRMTTNRKLALLMGRFTAEDTVQSLRNSRCSPELESVQASTSVRRAISMMRCSLGDCEYSPLGPRTLAFLFCTTNFATARARYT